VKIWGVDDAPLETTWGMDIYKTWDADKLPQIKSIGLYYTDYVAGVKIEYTNGQVFE